MDGCMVNTNTKQASLVHQHLGEIIFVIDSKVLSKHCLQKAFR